MTMITTISYRPVQTRQESRITGLFHVFIAQRSQKILLHVFIAQRSQKVSLQVFFSQLSQKIPLREFMVEPRRRKADHIVVVSPDSPDKNAEGSLDPIGSRLVIGFFQ